MATGSRKVPRKGKAAAFELSGGRLALDFANTVDSRPTGRRKDRLGSYADVVAWSRQAKVVTPALAGALLAAARRRPALRARAFARAVGLREALFRAFSRLAGGATPEAADLALVESEARNAAARRRLARSGDAYAWEWDAGAGDLDRVLWPVAIDAAELLTSDRLGCVRECAADNCAWLFMDESRNRSRVWCDMRVCGNRAKARRHYAKIHGRLRRLAPRRGARPRGLARGRNTHR